MHTQSVNWMGSGVHQIVESIRLEQTSETESNLSLNITMPTRL